MSPSRDRPRDRDELEDQLDDLENTLTDLRRELRSEPQRTPPKPPSLSELLRFTEEYTIPTLIALLEATIQSLELLRRTLRLADPSRAVREDGDATRSRLDQVGSEAGHHLAGALSELRTALSEADLPENPESRRLIDDARDLTGEIETRLRDAEHSVRDQRDRERRSNRDAQPRDTDQQSRDRGIMIDVRDAGSDDTTEQTDGESDSDSTTDTTDNDESPETPQVDVDSELQSIKDELDRSQQALDAAEGSTDETDTDETDTDETTAAADDSDASGDGDESDASNKRDESDDQSTT